MMEGNTKRKSNHKPRPEKQVKTTTTMNTRFIVYAIVLFATPSASIRARSTGAKTSKSSTNSPTNSPIDSEINIAATCKLAGEVCTSGADTCCDGDVGCPYCFVEPCRCPDEGPTTTTPQPRAEVAVFWEQVWAGCEFERVDIEFG
jgi:hypothetical protein